METLATTEAKPLIPASQSSQRRTKRSRTCSKTIFPQAKN